MFLDEKLEAEGAPVEFPDVGVVILKPGPELSEEAKEALGRILFKRNKSLEKAKGVQQVRMLAQLTIEFLRTRIVDWHAEGDPSNHSIMTGDGPLEFTDENVDIVLHSVPFREAVSDAMNDITNFQRDRPYLAPVSKDEEDQAAEEISGNSRSSFGSS